LELVLQLAEDKKHKIYDKALGAIKHWLERFDTIIIGPGLGRDEMVHHVVIEVSPRAVLVSLLADVGCFCLPTSSLHCCSHFCCVTLLLPDHGHCDCVTIRLCVKKSTGCWQLPAEFWETTRSEYSTMQLHVVC